MRPTAVAEAELIQPHPLLARTVEVRVVRQAEIARSLPGKTGGLVLCPPDTRDPPRPAGTAIGVATVLVVLGHPEIRQHGLVVPAGIAQRRPVVVVLTLTADVDHAVDRAGTAEDLATRPVIDAALHVGVRLGLQTPVDLGVVVKTAETRRHVDEEPVRGTPGFEQQHAVLPLGGEPVGEHATRRSGTDHDEIVQGRLRHPLHRPQNFTRRPTR